MLDYLQTGIFEGHLQDSLPQNRRPDSPDLDRAVQRIHLDQRAEDWVCRIKRV